MIYSAAVSMHFLFKVDLVQFSLLFACFDFNEFIVNIQLRKRSRLQVIVGCLNKKASVLQC